MALFESRTISGGGDDTWLKSRDGVNVAQSATLDQDEFTGEYVPSGTPVQLDTAGELYVPYVDDADTLRFVLGDHSFDASGVVPVIHRGYVIVENLPVAFEAPVGTQFTFDPAPVEGV